MTKISSLTAQTGTAVDTAADLLPIVDMSLAGTARNKKITVDELAIALAEAIRDTIGTALTAGTGVTVTVNDPGDTITIAVDTTAEAERVRDVIGTALVAGTNVTITVNDPSDTITIDAAAGSVASLDDVGDVNAPTPSNGDVLTWDSTPGEWVPQAVGAGYTAENARDDVGAALVAGTLTEITVNDPSDTITVAYKFSGAKVRKASNLTGQNLTGFVAVTFDTEDWDTDTYHSTVSNTDRLTPPAAGKYMVSGYAELANVASGNWVRVVLSRYNSSNAYQEDIIVQQIELTITGTFQFSATGITHFNSGDYAKMNLQTETDTSVDITTNTHFAIWRIG